MLTLTGATAELLFRRSRFANPLLYMTARLAIKCDFEKCWAAYEHCLVLLVMTYCVTALPVISGHHSSVHS